MRRRSVCAEKQTRDQTGALHAAREISAASVKPAERNKEPVGRDITVTTENTASALPEIGNDHDIGLVVSGAGFDPCLPLAHVIRASQVCVPVGPPNLKAAEFLDQEEVHPPSDRVG